VRLTGIFDVQTRRSPRRGLVVGWIAIPMLLPALLLGSCESPPPPPRYAPLNYDYLSKIRLMVATLDIDNAFTKTGTAEQEHVEDLAPQQPADLLGLMARERLVVSGASGHAVFVIEDASLTRAPGGFAGSMAVRLDISTSDGAKSGFAEAKVSRTYQTEDTSFDGTKAALYQLEKLMMDDMNVEFEYEVRHKLHDYLQPGDGAAPPPAPVQSQDLSPAPPPPADLPAVAVPPPPTTP